MNSKFIAWAQIVSFRNPQPRGNSREAIDHAYSLGFDGVEMDLQLTRDGVPVLMHDDTIDATTNGTGRVKDYTFLELQMYTLGHWQGWQTRIVSLEEALQANGPRGTFLCDMRVEAGAIGAIQRAVARAEFDPARLQISVYNRTEGEVFKRGIPEAAVFVKTYEMGPEIAPSTIEQRVGDLDGLMVQVPDKSPSIRPLVDRLHEMGKRIVTFVHFGGFEPSGLQRLVDDRVDFILTMNHQYADEIRRCGRILP